eukprot:gene11528-biopygen4867
MADSLTPRWQPGQEKYNQTRCHRGKIQWKWMDTAPQAPHVSPHRTNSELHGVAGTVTSRGEALCRLPWCEQFRTGLFGPAHTMEVYRMLWVGAQKQRTTSAIRKPGKTTPEAQGGNE